MNSTSAQRSFTYKKLVQGLLPITSPTESSGALGFNSAGAEIPTCSRAFCKIIARTGTFSLLRSTINTPTGVPPNVRTSLKFTCQPASANTSANSRPNAIDSASPVTAVIPIAPFGFALNSSRSRVLCSSVRRRGFIFSCSSNKAFSASALLRASSSTLRDITVVLCVALPHKSVLPQK